MVGLLLMLVLIGGAFFVGFTIGRGLGRADALGPAPKDPEAKP